MILKVKKLRPAAFIPTYATDGSACIDLYAPHDWWGVDSIEIPLGIAVEVPKGYALMIYGRSGMAFNRGLRLANCVGVIDSDYRGELVVKLTKDYDNHDSFRITAGSRIAQAMLIPVPHITCSVVDELSDTGRGTGGFGSTGA